MIISAKKRLFFCGTVLVVVAIGSGLVWWFWPESGDTRLGTFVRGRPPVPIVFTSRSEPASFQAVAAQGTGFTYPGLPQWQAREGRLRVLTPLGAVRELTWGALLPDGDTLIDVMSPSISLDNKTVFFAGRRQKDHGRFRLYEIGLDGRGLKQLTGGPDDAGATAAPPMRFRTKADEAWPAQALALSTLPTPGLSINLALAAAAGPALIPEAKRRRVDFDDIDPVQLPDGRIAFVSSRIPDLGRGHIRRATHLWVMALDGSAKNPITSNRNNDRWPVHLETLSALAFSTWSRNTEVISADLTDIRPHHAGLASATNPTDSWQGFRVAPNGDQFGMVLKLQIPVWRPQPLANDQLVFMTTADYGKPGWNPESPQGLTIAQAPMNLVTNVASARPHDRPLPRQAIDGVIRHGPIRNQAGELLTLATPAPCPNNKILFAGAARDPSQPALKPGQFGIYLASARWGGDTQQPANAQSIGLQLLFDDPDLVDAEPIAVYPRNIQGVWADVAGKQIGADLDEIEMEDGTYRGPVGQVLNANLNLKAFPNLPGQTTDAQEGPILQESPDGTIDHMRFFASYRDRFDHPWLPRLEGPWKLLLKVPLDDKKREFVARLPAGVPTVLAGFTSDGKVAQWTTSAQDTDNVRATFYAFAGDHYSSVKAREQGFCMGCHPGHTALEANPLKQKRR